MYSEENLDVVFILVVFWLMGTHSKSRGWQTERLEDIVCVWRGAHPGCVGAGLHMGFVPGSYFDQGCRFLPKSVSRHNPYCVTLPRGELEPGGVSNQGLLSLWPVCRSPV